MNIRISNRRKVNSLCSTLGSDMLFQTKKDLIILDYSGTRKIRQEMNYLLEPHMMNTLVKRNDIELKFVSPLFHSSPNMFSKFQLI